MFIYALVLARLMKFSFFEAFKGSLPYLLIILIGLLMFFPIFKPGALVSGDSPVHLAQSYAFISTLENHHWFSGMSNDAFAGYPIQLYPKYQLSQWFIAFFNLVFDIPVELSFKLVLLFSYVFVACMLYLLLSRRFGRSSAFLLSALFLLLRRDVVLMSLNGMFGSLLAAGFALLFIHFFDLYFSRLNLRRSIILSFLFSLTALGHLYAAFVISYFILVYFLVYVFVRRIGFFAGDFNRKLFFSVFLVAISILQVAFFVFPAFDMAGWLDTDIGWPPTYNLYELPYKTIAPLIFSVPKGIVTHEFFSSFSSGNLVLFFKMAFSYIVSSLPQFFIFFMAVIGLFSFSRFDSKNVFLMSFLFVGIISLVFGSGFWFLFPSLKSLPVLSNFQFYRFILFANISLVVFACYALYSLFSRGSHLYRFFSESYFLSHFFVVRNYLLALFIVFLAVNFGYFTPSSYETATLPQAPYYNDVDSTLSWVSSNIRDSRILLQDFYHNVDDPYLGSSHLPSLYSAYTGVPSIGGWYDSSSYPIDRFASSFSKSVFGKSVAEISPDELRNYMVVFNSKYALAVEPGLEGKFSSSLFAREYSSGNLSVFSLRGYTPDWVNFRFPSSHNTTLIDDWNIALEFDSPIQNNEVFVKFAYHPYWHAYMDSYSLPLLRNSYEMMTVYVPKGGHTLLLSYEPVVLPYFIVTLITLAGCFGVLLFWRD